MSPRRSSRARVIQPPLALPQHTNSSTSSTSSGRAERSARTNQKLHSPQSPAAPRSRSSQEADDPGRLQIRRTRSTHGETKEHVKIAIEHEDDEDEEGEEEVTRCVCGHQDYPGLPILLTGAHKVNSKGGGGSSSEPPAVSTVLPEDAGGLFIQCDTCKVWQHGGCVGIMEGAMGSEEPYFCEQCRKDLHRMAVAANGQKYSRYLPAQDTASIRSSPSPSLKGTLSARRREGKASRSNAENMAGNRRSTMNSRDAAYDEAEQLRRAIEESKREGGPPETSMSIPKGKRSRSDSEQRKEDIKRQRIGSDSSSTSESKIHPSKSPSDDEGDNRNKINHKSMRGAAAKNHREKEIREREEKRERERADAAGRRKGRAERRRGDESDPSEEPPSRTTSSKGVEPPLPANTPRPPAPRSPPPSKNSHQKKTGRPPAKRGRVGRNQYTKDRESRPSDPIRPDPTTSPSNSHPRIHDTEQYPRNLINGDASTAANAIAVSSNPSWATAPTVENGKPSKPRHMNPNRTTMNDMKRRVSGILDFISRTQIEMAASNATGEDPVTTSALSRAGTRSHSTVGAQGPNGSGKSDQQLPNPIKKGSSTCANDHDRDVDERRGKESTLDVDAFKGLNSLEMMEVLTRGLMRWQGEFGKAGEK